MSFYIIFMINKDKFLENALPSSGSSWRMVL